MNFLAVIPRRQSCDGVREDGQKVLLAIKSMGGESTEAWRTVLDDPRRAVDDEELGPSQTALDDRLRKCKKSRFIKNAEIQRTKTQSQKNATGTAKNS